MFKDYNKYLAISLKVYIFVLLIVFILKLVGMDYFGLDLNNPTVININNFYIKYKIDVIWCIVSIFIQLVFILGIICRKNKLYKEALIGTILTTIVQLTLMHYNLMQQLYFLYSTLLFTLYPIIINKKFGIKRQIITILLSTLYQAISLMIRNVSFDYEYGNLLIDNILNIDQLLMLGITYNLVMLKGDINLWEQVHSLSLQKNIPMVNML